MSLDDDFEVRAFDGDTMHVVVSVASGSCFFVSVDRRHYASAIREATYQLAALLKLTERTAARVRRLRVRPLC